MPDVRTPESERGQGDYVTERTVPMIKGTDVKWFLLTFARKRKKEEILSLITVTLKD